MTVGKIENGLERGFVKHRLNCLLVTDPIRCLLYFALNFPQIVLTVIVSVLKN